jgi:hypothetical protein
MDTNNTALPDETRRIWFVVIVAYYVLATYLTPSSAKVERFSFAYFALVIPAWLYVIGNWRCLLTGYGTASKLLALFVLLSGISGVIRADYPLAYNAIFLAAMAIVIVNSRVYLTVVELNWLFLCTVIGSVIVYGMGITEYGFLPGQAEAAGCHAVMNWRVSLFRVTAESAMFSFIILVANILYGDRVPWWARGLTILLATYFLVFSGVRSIVFPASAVSLICILSVLPRFSVNMRRRFITSAAVALMVILLVPFFLGVSGGAFWKNYVLRTQTCDYQLRYSTIDQETKPETKPEGIPPDWYAWTFNRHCAAMYQLFLFAGSPMGNQDVYPKSDQILVDIGCPTDQIHYYCASCNFSTYWLARAGIPALPLLMCFLVLMAGAITRRDAALSWILVVFGVVSFSWGVMFVPYNFIFQLLMAMPALVSAHERHLESS